MAEQQIQLRRGTTTQWSTSNPILLSGEIGFDTTTGTFKIGNGTSAWNALTSYASGSTDPEVVRDTIAAALAGSGLISVTANDAADTITISTTATANDTDANLKNRANHTGTQSADTLTDGSTNRLYTSTEKTKLSGIATSATANDTDANLKNRANHTGSQAISTVTNLQTTLDSKVDSSDIDNIVVLTAAAYAALATKDSRTFYVQVG